MPTTTIADERAAARKAVAAAGLSKTDEAAALKALRGAICIYTKRVADDALPLGASHLGGWPDLPAGVEWPRLDAFPMTFIGQFRLEDVAPHDIDHSLPESGLLSFFLYDSSPPDVAAPKWYSAHRVLYTRDVSTLRRVDAPEELYAKYITRQRRGPKATAAVTFRVGLQLPAPGTPDAAGVPGVSFGSKVTSRSWLLGYYVYEGYAAPPRAGTRNLFHCESDDQAALEFGDAQDIAFH
ncbi:MAG: DUF1963 domain-containing protein, partial [Polyangiales bacterium]